MVRLKKRFSAVALICFCFALSFAGASAPVIAQVDPRLSAEVKDLDAQIAKDPKDWNLYAKRGKLLYSIDRPEEALADFRKATDIKPDWVEGYCFMGSYLMRKKHYHEAVVIFGIAETYENYPHLDAVRSARSYCLLKDERYQDALNSAKKALATRPTDAIANFTCGMSTMKLNGARSEVLQYLREAVRLDPSNQEYAAALRGAESAR